MLTTNLNGFFVQNLDELKINQIAKETSFCKRIRKVSPISFLKSLCFKTFDAKQQSLNDHCSDFLIDEKVTITKQSFNEKFNKNTLSFLKNVLNALKISDKLNFDTGLLSQFSNVFIQDGTYFKLPDAYLESYPGIGNSNTAGAKIQFTFDFKNGNFSEIELFEGKRSDAKSATNCDWITKNSLVIRDLGYFSLDSLKEVDDKKAFYISKVQPRTVLYQKINNKFERIDIKKLVNFMKNNNIKTLNTEIYIGNKKQIITTATIQIQPDYIVNERIRTKKKIGEQRSWKMSDEYIYWAHLNVYITNIKEVDIKFKDIVKIYRLRWQIELMFKTWKSHHNIHKYKNFKKERFECYVYASLIGLMCQYKIYHYFNAYCLKTANKLVSILKISKVMIQLRSVLKLLFSSKEYSINSITNHLIKLKKDLYLETKKDKINQYNILNIN
jgi:hypothetical protein